MDIVVQIVIAAVSGGVVSALINAFANRGKVGVETKDIEERITKAVLDRAEEQLKSYKAENDSLKEETKKKDDLINQLRLKVEMLRGVMQKMYERMKREGIDPDLTDVEANLLFDTDKLMK